MSQFRETFTKEEKKDPLLDYDDSAFLYFAGSLLLCVLIPWTYCFVSALLFPYNSVAAREFPVKSRSGSVYRYCQCSFDVTRVENAKKRAASWKNRLTVSFVLQLIALIGLWYSFYLLSQQLSGEKEIQAFDPYAILEISMGASDREIKKAYRFMSLKYHPDKNPNDPLAASKFLLISKAYQALTDEVAKMNWEKYGNPDGPGTMKVGIGLPRFLLEEDQHLLILCTFFIFLLFFVPLTFICYYQRQKKYAPTGVQVDTLHFLSYYLTDGTRVKNAPEFVAASAESRELQLRPTDNEEMAVVIREVVEPKKRQFTQPIIVRNYFLILAHMQRLHDKLSPSLQSDLNALLSASLKITQSMIEIAQLREWILTAQSMVEFRRGMVQALDVKSSSLLQIPHFDEELLKHCHKGKNAVRDLTEFISQTPEERKGLSKMNPQQLADVQAFCSHVSDMELSAAICVQDEEEIVEGDVATVTVKLDGEAMGPVHAPFFPDTKFEEWWIFLTDKASGGLIAQARSRSPEKYVEEQLQFQVPTKQGSGKMVLLVTAMCDSYSGIDRTTEVEYKVFGDSEVKRSVYVHPEDEALDSEPTLFQQMLGAYGEEEESEDEDEDQRAAAKKIQQKKLKSMSGDLNGRPSGDNPQGGAMDDEYEDYVPEAEADIPTDDDDEYDG
ncbi:unnamed protein product [Vitrella brassicaformis CCMP3155]|uniref:J domain-containing protein n=1 Tax=Vitrella brassicaformis (strain CCMP3155) TaxID=1169540 RepID=A0A0G4GJI7_VITBC|nr:unnamed protein product [Vitrella brassicaformis CCMP3155]|eukprot:CEM30111.1 unnamed protein product [Vitrella brassicaformis CCMP3155]